jgi:galactofuranosylgalactofuranosylrhamnosyl-N-acetylglucosaminyl-diphospho-decaprenol beta-1,5/1,6-galactofuranosyltransferase
MPDLIIQRVVFPVERPAAALYYTAAGPRGRPGEPALLDRRSVRIEPGTTLGTATYFNSFFEGHWREYTKLGALVLRLRVSGRGTVRLLRQTAEAGAAVLEAADFRGDSREVVLNAPGPRFHFRELGALSFELTARSGPVTLHQADWVATDVDPAPVQLVAGYCTCDREGYLLKGLALLGADADVLGCLRKIVVVDQGSRRVTAHPSFGRLPPGAAGKVVVIEQANFGGAGGFTRSILEALNTRGATHMLLMDDDAELEPESVYRAARLLALAREDLAVGGNMLDLLRPNELFELNAEVYPRLLAMSRLVGGFRVDRPEELGRLLEVHTTRYNGWWFMAFPLRVVERVGLPLPFFLRCDDIEFGCRLQGAGVPVAPVPGVAVWHAPFYLKTRGWQNYYEFRNMLALCALRYPQPGRRLARVFLRRLVKRLLCHEYYEAWLLCEAVRDYFRGPSKATQRPSTAGCSGPRSVWRKRPCRGPGTSRPSPRRRPRHGWAVGLAPPGASWGSSYAAPPPARPRRSTPSGRATPPGGRWRAPTWWPWRTRTRPTTSS